MCGRAPVEKSSVSVFLAFSVISCFDRAWRDRFRLDSARACRPLVSLFSFSVLTWNNTFFFLLLFFCTNSFPSCAPGRRRWLIRFFLLSLFQHPKEISAIRSERDHNYKCRLVIVRPVGGGTSKTIPVSQAVSWSKVGRGPTTGRGTVIIDSFSRKKKKREQSPGRRREIRPSRRVSLSFMWIRKRLTGFVFFSSRRNILERETSFVVCSGCQ